MNYQMHDQFICKTLQPDILWLPIDPVECKEITEALGFSYAEMLANGTLASSGSFRDWPPSKIKVHTGWDIVHLAISQASRYGYPVPFVRRTEFVTALLDEIASILECPSCAAFCPEAIDFGRIASTILREASASIRRDAVEGLIKSLPAMKAAWLHSCHILGDYFNAWFSQSSNYNNASIAIVGSSHAQNLAASPQPAFQRSI